MMQGKLDTDTSADKEMKQLLKILKSEGEAVDDSRRWAKQKKILTLLAAGSVLAFSLVAPGTARLIKLLDLKQSDEDDWRVFNRRYLRSALKKLEAQKIIEFVNEGKTSKVVLTEKGKRRVLSFKVEEMTIPKPARWDGKWRLVFYDVPKSGDKVRDYFRSYLKSFGFYPWQKSVYVHAYPCEKEIDFLRHYLGIGSEVRLIVAETIENDEVFRKYFNVS